MCTSLWSAANIAQLNDSSKFTLSGVEGCPHCLMPKYYPPEPGEEVVEEKKPGRACQGLREDLKSCLLASDCVRIDHRIPKDCLQMMPHPSVPSECQALSNAFFDCKRSILDMRSRFRGRKGY